MAISNIASPLSVPGLTLSKGTSTGKPWMIPDTWYVTQLDPHELVRPLRKLLGERRCLADLHLVEQPLRIALQNLS